MKVNKYSLFVDLVCALLITTLVQTILPFNINRIIGFGLFFISFFLLLDKKNKKHFKILFLSGISVLFSFFYDFEYINKFVKFNLLAYCDMADIYK